MADYDAGLKDTNLARVKATKDYLQTCHHTFIVANIHRAVTNLTVHDSVLGRMTEERASDDGRASARRLSSVAIVYTKSDVSSINHLKIECLVNRKNQFQEAFRDCNIIIPYEKLPNWQILCLSRLGAMC